MPNSPLTVFTSPRSVNDAVDEVRPRESKENAALRNTRYLWLKNPDNPNAEQTKKLDHLAGISRKTGLAYRIRLAFQDLFIFLDQVAGEGYLKRWCFWATRSCLEPIERAARTIKAHWDGVLSWFDSRISTGLLEGTDSLIQAAKARARGYRTAKNPIAMSHIIAGKLAYDLPT
jgi:transposase